jgi:hypothetical protein
MCAAAFWRKNPIFNLCNMAENPIVKLYNVAGKSKQLRHKAGKPDIQVAQCGGNPILQCGGKFNIQVVQ